MINEKEIEAVKLSASKKDFYQIWNELLETADKLSERWSPAATNESDPGIVLLKVLTAIADKLNYTIDKNTLECFMPSAAQEESMRKLCDMLGYSMKYYQSATTDVTISYTGDTTIADAFDAAGKSGYDSISLPKYTNIKNTDEDINYFTLEEKTIDDVVNKTISVTCMEGEVVLCADDTDNIVSISQLDDNNRYYLPETQIAENGIFIYNIDESTTSENWTKVDSLNSQSLNTHCFKFGFDSLKGVPYVQFPDDISNIIKDGLVIRYTRTNGANGNISYNTLSKLEIPSSWSSSDISSTLIADNFAVKNPSAAMNGKNKESLNDAYSNYKRTIGTFDTLVTCRDYINKIYQMTIDSTDTTPLVSNVVVSDIRDDINRAITLCTFNEYGIAYEDKSLRETITGTVTTYANLPANPALLDIYYVADEGNYYQCTVVAVSPAPAEWTRLIDFTMDKISHFDVVLYPFATVSGGVTKQEYINSFKYSSANKFEIEEQLEKNKTISHRFCYPNQSEIACIKNYLKLNAKITTNAKINTIEESIILNNIYNAIYENFYARKIDFSEEIPFDTILAVIQNADTRIKNVALEEPILYSKICLANGQEYDYAASNTDVHGKQLYNKLALRNILAGRIVLFDYDTSFKPAYTDKAYSVGSYSPIYGPKIVSSHNCYIGKIDTEFNVKDFSEEVTLNDNEIIQFRAPNFETVKTYASYVNYFAKLNTSGQKAYCAMFGTLREYMRGDVKFGATHTNKWANFVNTITGGLTEQVTVADAAAFTVAETKYGALFTGTVGSYVRETTAAAGTYSVFKIDSTTYNSIYQYILTQNANYYEEGTTFAKLKGIFKFDRQNVSLTPGYLIDANRKKYSLCDTALASTTTATTLDNYYIQVTHSADQDPTTVTGPFCDYDRTGLGKNAVTGYIKINEERKLGPNEWIAINYTPSVTNEDGTTGTSTPVNIVYKANDIFRANFELKDSTAYHTEGHTPSKKSGSGYTFDTAIQQVIDAVGGMYTLGSNEQIEIRDKVEVVLNDIATNIYWVRNDENDLTVSGDKIYFAWDEDPLNPLQPISATNPGMAYTLKDGEYIYYTDASKIDLAFYGNGTKIVRQNSTFNLYKLKSKAVDLVDKIASEGLLAALPWVSFDLSNNALTLKEYQYINLTTGDTLKNISFGITSQQLTKKWENVVSATYSYLDDSTEHSLPTITTGLISWEARSILAFNVSPTQKQILHSSRTANNVDKTENKITLKYYYWDNAEVYATGSDTIICPLLSSNAYVPLSIETNYLKQNYYGLVDTHVYSYNTDGEIDHAHSLNDFKVKVFEFANVTGTSHTSQSVSVSELNNYGNGSWTKINFENYNDFTLNVTVPSDTHGIIMFYYVDTETDPTKNAYITIETPTTGSPFINILNYSNASASIITAADKWWINRKVTSGTITKYIFRHGINIVEVPQSCTLKITADDAKKSTIVFSDLDIAKYNTTGNNFKINEYIDYKTYTGGQSTAIGQLLYDIAQVDKNFNFYYNTILDNSIAIDLNTSIPASDSDAELLSSPKTWYSYNNINNKFVISEIETDFSGITIASTSRK